MKLFLRLGGFMKEEGCLTPRLLEVLKQANLPVEVLSARSPDSRPELSAGDSYPREMLAVGVKDIAQVASDLAKYSLADVIKERRSLFFRPLQEETPAAPFLS